MKKIIKIILSIIILAIAFAMPFMLPRKQSFNHHNTTSCSTCSKVQEIKNETKANLILSNYHSYDNSNKCSYCNKIKNFKEDPLLLFYSKHRCFESDKISAFTSSINSIENSVIFISLTFTIILLIIVKHYCIVEKTTQNKSQLSPISLKDKLSS